MLVEGTSSTIRLSSGLPGSFRLRKVGPIGWPLRVNLPKLGIKPVHARQVLVVTLLEQRGLPVAEPVHRQVTDQFLSFAPNLAVHRGVSDEEQQ